MNGEGNAIFSRTRVAYAEWMVHAGNKRYLWQSNIETVRRRRKLDTGL